MSDVYIHIGPSNDAVLASLLLINNKNIDTKKKKLSEFD